MSLELATEGCCKGHPCDNCKTCRRGRCCRRDNPHYQLPEFGEWDGPVYGKLGQLDEIGDKLECHVCGEWFSSLGSHVWCAHNINAAEYKALFGLKHTTPLAAQYICEKRRQTCIALDNTRAMLAARGDPSPERLSYKLKGRKQRLETMTQRQQLMSEPYYQEARRAGSRKAAETKKKRVLAGELSYSTEHLQQSWHDPAIHAKASEALRLRKESDPEWWEGVKEKISLAKGKRVELICSICGETVIMLAWLAKKRTTCGKQECTAELRRRNISKVNPSQSPEARSKISMAAKQRPITRDEMGRIVGKSESPTVL